MRICTHARAHTHAHMHTQIHTHTRTRPRTHAYLFEEELLLGEYRRQESGGVEGGAHHTEKHDRELGGGVLLRGAQIEEYSY